MHLYKSIGTLLVVALLGACQGTGPGSLSFETVVKYGETQRSELRGLLGQPDETFGADELRDNREGDFYEWEEGEPRPRLGVIKGDRRGTYALTLSTAVFLIYENDVLVDSSAGSDALMKRRQLQRARDEAASKQALELALSSEDGIASLCQVEWKPFDERLSVSLNFDGGASIVLTAVHDKGDSYAFGVVRNGADWRWIKRRDGVRMVQPGDRVTRLEQWDTRVGRGGGVTEFYGTMFRRDQLEAFAADGLVAELDEYNLDVPQHYFAGFLKRFDSEKADRGL